MLYRPFLLGHASCSPARRSRTAEGPCSDMACRAARSLEPRGAAVAALNCRPTHCSLSVPLIRTQHGANQADRSQVHRRQSPPQAAGHKGCPQVRPFHRRREEAPPLQVRRAPRAPFVLHAPFAHLLSLTRAHPYCDVSTGPALWRCVRFASSRSLLSS